MGMDTTTIFLTDVDVSLANITTTTVPIHELRHTIRQCAKRHRPNFDAPKYLWRVMRQQETDALNVDQLRQDVANCVWENNRMAQTNRCTSSLPKGFILPRVDVDIDAHRAKRRGWIKHPDHGWLAVANRPRGRRGRRGSMRSGLIFCLCVFILIAYLYLRKRKRMAQNITTYQSLDQAFIDAPAPTNLQMSPIMPSTTDLVNDFNELNNSDLGIRSASLRPTLY